MASQHSSGGGGGWYGSRIGTPTTDDEAGLAAALNRLRTSQARFELYEDRDGAHRWRLRHRNGNILADSGEGYDGRSDAREAIESVKRNAPNAGTGDDAA